MLVTLKDDKKLNDIRKKITFKQLVKINPDIETQLEELSQIEKDKLDK